MIEDGEIINHRLDGKIINGQERKYCRILTEEEEQTIVSYMKNKNRCLKGVNQSELTKFILDVIKMKDYTNKRSIERPVINLSHGYSPG